MGVLLNGLNLTPASQRKREIFTPAGTMVLARLEKPKTGLALPEGYQEPQPRVVIVAVGCGRMLECGQVDETKVAPGDVCLIAGQAIELQLDGYDEDDKLLLFDRKQVLGTVKTEE